MANTGNSVKYRVRKLIDGVEDTILDVRVSGIARKEESLRSYLLASFGADITEQQTLLLSSSQVTEDALSCPLEAQLYPPINGNLFRDSEWTNSELTCNLVFDPVTGNPIEAESVPAFSFNQDLNANDPAVPNSFDSVYIDAQGTGILSSRWYKYVVNSTIYAVQIFGGTVIQKIACIEEPAPPPPPPPAPEETTAFVIRTTQVFANPGDYISVDINGVYAGTMGNDNSFANPTIIQSDLNTIMITYHNTGVSSLQMNSYIRLTSNSSVVAESAFPTFAPPGDVGIDLMQFSAVAGNSYYIEVNVSPIQ